MNAADRREAPAWDVLPLDAAETRLVEAAADFVRDRIAPEVEGWERDRSPVSRELIRDWSALGFNGLQVPAAMGGQGASFPCKIRIAEIVARASFCVSFSLTNLQGSATRIAREGSEDQVRRYLPGLMSGEIVCAPSLSEPGAGSDFAAIATRATKVAGGWRIDGTKAWITNGAVADLLILYGQTEPGTGARGIASFLVDLHAAGVTRAEPYRIAGAHAIGTSEIAFADVFVPDADLLAPAGVAFKRALSGITGARTHVAAMACGIVADALARAVDHTRTRHAFGRPLVDNQGLRWQLADVATELEAARALTARAALEIEAGGDAILSASQAKRYAADMALRSVAACMQAMGATGLEERHPFARHLAGARVAAYVDGTTEMQRDRIGAYLASRYGSGATPDAR